MKHKVTIFFELSQAEKDLMRSIKTDAEAFGTLHNTGVCNDLVDKGILNAWIEGTFAANPSYTFTTIGKQIKKSLNL